MSPGGEAIIYIQTKPAKFFSKTYSEIFKSTIEFKDDEDRFSIRDSSSGTRLNVQLEEDKIHNIAVDDSVGFQTHVFVGHCNGKVEEVTLL